MFVFLVMSNAFTKRCYRIYFGQWRSFEGFVAPPPNMFRHTSAQRTTLEKDELEITRRG
jgi:hypothetical protein